MPSESFSARIAAEIVAEFSSLIPFDRAAWREEATPRVAALLDRHLAAAGGEKAEDVAWKIATLCSKPTGFAPMDAAEALNDEIKPLIARALLAEREAAVGTLASEVLQECHEWADKHPRLSVYDAPDYDHAHWLRERALVIRARQAGGGEDA